VLCLRNTYTSLKSLILNVYCLPSDVARPPVAQGFWKSCLSAWLPRWTALLPFFRVVRLYVVLAMARATEPGEHGRRAIQSELAKSRMFVQLFSDTPDNHS
jgi:hypothetical protein